MSDIYVRKGGFLHTVIKDCPVHGRWIFPDTPEGVAEARVFEFEHLEHKWPVSTRRFPAKSRKRVAFND